MWQPGFIKQWQALQKEQPRAVAKEMTAIYRNSVDAFAQLVASRHPSDISARLACLTNGIECCNVMVKFGGGAEYHVAAYGKEAEELYSEAIMRSAELKIAIPQQQLSR
jgi:hypothetical protein